MLKVQVRKITPVQVDFPDEGCERSKKGALHFRSNSTMRLTEDEHAHVLKTQPKLAKSLLVSKAPPKAKAAAEPKAKEAKAKPKPLSAAPAPDKEASSDGKPKAKGK